MISNCVNVESLCKIKFRIYHIILCTSAELQVYVFTQTWITCLWSSHLQREVCNAENHYLAVFCFVRANQMQTHYIMPSTTSILFRHFSAKRRQMKADAQGAQIIKWIHQPRLVGGNRGASGNPVIEMWTGKTRPCRRLTISSRREYLRAVVCTFPLYIVLNIRSKISNIAAALLPLI